MILAVGLLPCRPRALGLDLGGMPESVEFFLATDN